MSKHNLPAIQFYPGDWRKDPAVQSLNYHDRGVWFELLMLMHESERRGLLLLNGKPMPEDALARLLGLDKQILTTTLSTLLTYGVASLDEETGAIMSRRMVRDETVRQQKIKAGRMGGNPVLLKQTPKQTTTTGVKQNGGSSSSVSVSTSVEEGTAPLTIEDLKPQLVVSPETVSHLGAFRLDEAFMQFMDAGMRYGFQCSEEEWSAAYKWGWLKLQMPERLAAIKGIQDRLAAHDDSLSGATPKNYLTERKWKRKIQQPFAPVKDSKPSASDLIPDVTEQARAWAAKQRAKASGAA